MKNNQDKDVTEKSSNGQESVDCKKKINGPCISSAHPATHCSCFQVSIRFRASSERFTAATMWRQLVAIVSYILLISTINATSYKSLNIERTANMLLNRSGLFAQYSFST